MLWTFTGAGSLIHPIAMSILSCLWATTWGLGVIVRLNRLSAPHGEATPMLPRDMQSQSRRNRWHHKLSGALLPATVLFTGVAMYNTYLRSGKLFPGPHLYGAFWFLLCVSANVALVPWLADRKQIRNVHAGLGLVSALLLLRQVWSGLPILQGVWSTISIQ